MDIDLNDITLHVRDTGSATNLHGFSAAGGHHVPVVLLHGWPDTGDLWQHQVPALSAAGYRVIIPDLRGFGRSGKPADLAAYAAPVMVGDVLGVLNALDIECAHIVGHDWGAAIAWMTAGLAPARIASITALSVGHPEALRSAGLPQREKSWYMLLFQFIGVAERWLSDDGFRNLREWSAHPDIEPVVERFTDPAALTASLALYRAILPPESLVDARALVPPVAAPAMGVWSSGDRALIEEGMTRSAEYVTGPWRYERVEDAGHWLQVDAPDKFNALLLDFLSQHSQGATTASAGAAGTPRRVREPS